MIRGPSQNLSTSRPKVGGHKEVELTSDDVVLCTGLQHRVSNIEFAGNFDSRPHKPVRFVATKQKRANTVRMLAVWERLQPRKTPIKNAQLDPDEKHQHGELVDHEVEVLQKHHKGQTNKQSRTQVSVNDYRFIGCGLQFVELIKIVFCNSWVFGCLKSVMDLNLLRSSLLRLLICFFFFFKPVINVTSFFHDTTANASTPTLTHFPSNFGCALDPSG